MDLVDPILHTLLLDAGWMRGDRGSLIDRSMKSPVAPMTEQAPRYGDAAPAAERPSDHPPLYRLLFQGAIWTNLNA
jgi:hypothetical protein